MNTSRIAMKVALKMTGRISQRRVSVEGMRRLCDDRDRGTREGSILVSKAPASTAGNGAQGDGVRSAGREAARRAPADGDAAARRRELADFLRTRRAAISPEDVGLPGGGRRRTPGLRREEVAQLAGVGTTWYTWLEQARDVRASAEVLEAVARALQLTQAERAHLLDRKSTRL